MSSIGGEKPLLSICIPTFNQAELLRLTLSTIVPQVRELEGEVELVVSDNCSDDHTRTVVDSFMQLCPINYHRNNENIGIGRNIALLTGRLARGEFCWLIGDDIIREGGVRKVVEILKAHPELDYVYVNYCQQTEIPKENEIAAPDTGIEWPGLGTRDLREKRVDRWEELLEEDSCCLTAIYSSVFRLSLWREAMSSLNIGPTLTNVDTVYPQTIILAKTMLGKPCRSTGYPWVAFGTKYSHTDYFPPVVLLCQNLLDVLEELGVDPKYLRTHRRGYLRVAARYLPEVAQNPKTPRPDIFSFWDFLFRYFENRELVGFFIFLWVFEIRKGFREYPAISVIAMCARPLVLLVRQVRILRNARNVQ